ncbi:iron-containing redox enzyme family protein [Colwellia sp. 1_MG-2023]|uniref:iron-containing redox enzyme family protein n=1 Tax=Colwellia sp. 1_MG-2023 TaxID=3062649 RepID=UPI0026E1A6CA|nr:iron-containing redox enzyme family protein [Colwellia sp. 1_MG-2023]MDO6445914.1 iron-containing redox enzyme family protein [Colwellia sp. 1_MG-2023]
MVNNIVAQSFYERLSKNLHLLELKACDVNARFFELATHSEVIVEQCLTNYRTSNAAVPMMREVIRCAKLMPDDPVSAPLIKYMEQHIPEETGHDQWCIDDLAVLGVTEEQIHSKIPSPNIMALIGSQYYMIRHQHPVAIMGYLACLETHPPTIEYVEGLIEKSGLPAAAFSGLMHHAKIDPHHKQDIINTLNSLPLTEKQYQLVERSAFLSLRYVALMMEDVCKAAPVDSLVSI